MTDEEVEVVARTMEPGLMSIHDMELPDVSERIAVAVDETRENARKWIAALDAHRAERKLSEGLSGTVRDVLRGAEILGNMPHE